MHGSMRRGLETERPVRVTAVKQPAGETRGKVAARPNARQRHRASPRPYIGNDRPTSAPIIKVLLAWGDRGVDALTGPKSRSTCKVKDTGWLKGLEATRDAT
jgi:hypothetical protein